MFGIGVSPEEVTSIARSVNCSHGSLPFIYLGLPVGRSMKKIEAWNDVVNKFTRRLSSWKANMLSIGERLTLVKSMFSSLPLYYHSLFKAPTSVISLLESIRRRFFWGFKDDEKKMVWWRFLNESDALWRRVIVEFHGVNGGFDQTTGYMRNSGMWASIVRSCLELEHMSIDLDNLMERKVLSGNQTHFWTDCWIKNHGPLKNPFPILYALETSKDCFVADRWVLEDGFWHAKWSWRRHPSGRAYGELDHLVSLINGLVLDSNLEDKWFWSLDNSRVFSVKSLSRAVQDKLFLNNDPAPPFTWNSWVPRKVNVCVWRLALNQLPIRSNLIGRGVSIPSIVCLFCGIDEESQHHCFLSSSKIKIIWRKLWSWWRSPPLYNPSLEEILNGKSGFIENKSVAKLFHAVCMTFIWHVWNWRNKILHAPSDPEADAIRHEDIFPSAGL
ncbi:RNA-directed DNA polymerase, eukaryota, reverse transcriptase zinc-binding domain protein [Tanacetum coccineum]